MRSCGDLTRSNSFLWHLLSSLMLIKSGSEKPGQVNPAMKDMALKSMGMAKISMKNSKMDECMTQMKAASDAMKK
jgi:hypothetical protein